MRRQGALWSGPHGVITHALITRLEASVSDILSLQVLLAVTEEDACYSSVSCSSHASCLSAVSVAQQL
jgi:hypothetical protein